MKTEIAIVIFMLVLMSCGESPGNILEPTDGLHAEYGFDSNEEEICHDNMLALGEGCSMFYGKYNCYPDSLQELEEIDPELCDLVCPSCSLSYLYETDGDDNFSITCPSPSEPNHGFFMNGMPYWPVEPSLWPSVCHNNMNWLRIACSMYYGKYNTYPDSLNDLVEEGYIPQELLCPECGEPYLYTTRDPSTTYLIRCPVPTEPNHGYVEDGVCHWPPDPPYCDDCRNQMLCLAAGMSMFYGKYNRYPDSLEELGTSHIMENWYKPCPACGEIYQYEMNPQDTTYLIRCPAPIDPMHGSVFDGMVSWE